MSKECPNCEEPLDENGVCDECGYEPVNCDDSFYGDELIMAFRVEGTTLYARAMQYPEYCKRYEDEIMSEDHFLLACSSNGTCFENIDGYATQLYVSGELDDDRTELNNAQVQLNIASVDFNGEEDEDEYFHKATPEETMQAYVRMTSYANQYGKTPEIELREIEDDGVTHTWTVVK